MVLNCNKLPEELKRGVLKLEQYQFLKTDDNGVPIKAIQGEEILIKKTDTEIVITYNTKPHFYMALARCMGMKVGVQRISPKLKDFGFMLDCSRNAVATPEMVKRLICLLVLFGYNYLELYTEDTYELPGEHYFGYKRGRYSAEELKSVVAFADIFGLEMVPCIQTLAHLRSLRSWGVYFDHMDINDILLVGDERTYKLIEKMLTFCREVFQTKRINIGTDEAFYLGRGKYADIHGFRPSHDIYVEHLKKVFEMCKEAGFEPEFWADAFCDETPSEEEVHTLFDGSQTPIYWKYDPLEKEKHVDIMRKLQNYAGKVIYAGACMKWVGYAPCNEYSERAIDPAFEAAFECGLDHILMTTWGDGGDECSVFATISTMWYAAHKVFPCDVDENGIVALLTGYTKEEWRSCDEVDYLAPHTEKLRCTATKDLLFNDFLIGIMDLHIPDWAGERYQELYEKFRVLARRDSQFVYIFEAYAALCHAVIRKATYSKRLYEAYQKQERNTIETMIDELPVIKKDIKEFYDAFRRMWLTENKGFGFEVSDVRIGSLISRIDTVEVMLNDYLEGRIDKIYELEEERISFWNTPKQGDEMYAVQHGDWPYNFSMNYVLHHMHTL